MMLSPRPSRRGPSSFARRIAAAAGSIPALAAIAAFALPPTDLLAGGLPRVALIASASDSQLADVQSKLVASGQFSEVDVYNVSISPPRPFPGGLGLLMTYDAVMFWSNNTITNPADVGNLLADYVDTGKGVVLAVSAVTSNNTERQLQGRWASDGYGILLPGNGTANSASNIGTVQMPMHPIMNGVVSIANNFLGIRSSPTTPIAGHGVLIAEWLDGAPLAAVSNNPALNRRADLGLYPPSSTVSSAFWDATTDGAVFMANAITFSAAGMGGNFPPAADITFSNLIGVSGTSVIISATVTPGVNPASTGVTVTADLSAFGGSSTQLLADQGGNLHTSTLNIPALQPAGNYTINATVTDAQLRTTSASASILIIPPAPPGYTAEIEPNESKANATPATINVGGGVYGISTGSFVTMDGSIGTPDYFLLTLTPKPQLGIYRHTMTLETDGEVGHGASLRGYSQGSGGINLDSDTAVQTSVATTFPPRTNAWYGFGRAEQMFYRVIGNTSSTLPYRGTLTTEEILPIDLGFGQELNAGEITISRFGHTTAVDMMVYDQNFLAFEDCNTDSGTSMVRTYPAGTYYLALSNVNTADHRASGPGSVSLTGPVLHFPGSVANSSTVGIGNLSMQFDDGVNNVSVFATKDIFFGVAWIKFVVTGGECPGDFNNDGVVDLGDLLDFLGLWNPNLGSSVAPGTNGDINSDGVVDLADLLTFLADWNPNLGATCP